MFQGMSSTESCLKRLPKILLVLYTIYFPLKKDLGTCMEEYLLPGYEDDLADVICIVWISYLHISF